jgi:hypothetical protein
MKPIDLNLDPAHFKPDTFPISCEKLLFVRLHLVALRLER